MAQQKFSNSFREALWETYGKKCFHCNGELLLADMRVDHIVPEHLHYGERAKREAALGEIGLPLTFDILGRPNLAPTCERCNGQKSGSVLIARSTAVALTRIERTLPKLEKSLSQKRKARELESILLAISRSLESGKFTREEFVLQLKIAFPNFPALSPTRKADKEDGGPLPNANNSRPRRSVRAEIRGVKVPGSLGGPIAHVPTPPSLFLNEVSESIIAGLADGTAKVEFRKGWFLFPNRYVVSGPNNLSVVFVVNNEKVWVLRAHAGL